MLVVAVVTEALLLQLREELEDQYLCPTGPGVGGPNIGHELPDGRRRLLTSYHLDSEHERIKMRKKWERRLPRPVQNKRPPTSGGPTPSTMGG